MARKTTNSYQEHYMLAKAHLETLEAKMLEDERQMILEQGITNPDGSIPQAIYCIEDEAIFDRMNEAHGAMVEASGEWQEILTARTILEEAENHLIAFGLSIAPAGIRETLRDGVKTNYTTRQKFIDLTLKLDASTIPGRRRA